MLADEDLAGVDDGVDGVALDRRVDGHLQVLRGDAVGHGDGFVEVGGDDAPAVDAEGGAGGVRPYAGKLGELDLELGIDGQAQRFVGREQHDRGVDAVLGLDQQIGGETLSGRRCCRR